MNSTIVSKKKSKLSIKYEESEENKKVKNEKSVKESKSSKKSLKSVNISKSTDSIEENNKFLNNSNVDLNHNKMPRHFPKQFENIKKMRNYQSAPVDSMGVEFTISEDIDRPTTKFQTLVSLILSAQTKDQTTYAVMKKLVEYGLTAEKISKISQEKLIDLIYGVNFHNNKSRAIIDLAKEIVEKYDGEAPETYQEITKFRGIGPKMAHLYLQCCCNKIEGVAVDVHVHRICNRLNWTKSKTPEDTRKQLEEWLPKEHWVDINFALVGFGQTICDAKRPKCTECTITDSCGFFKENKNKLDLTKIKKNKRSKSVTPSKLLGINNKKDDQKSKRHLSVKLTKEKFKENEELLQKFEPFDDDDFERDFSFLRKRNKEKIENSIIPITEKTKTKFDKENQERISIKNSNLNELIESVSNSKKNVSKKRNFSFDQNDFLEEKHNLLKKKKSKKH